MIENPYQPRRSLIFTNGLRPEMFAKALNSGADMVCVDLEDAIALEHKDQARKFTLPLFNGAGVDDGEGDSVERLVRINGLRTAEGLADIYVVDIEGGLPRRITPDAAIDLAPSWSHNQAWIYFASNRSGTWQVWKMPAGGGEAVQVTEHGGYVAFEAPDGQSIYFTRRDTAGIWQQAVDGGEARLVVDALAPVHAGNWAVTEAGLYFVDTENKPATIAFFDFATRQITQAAVPNKEPTWNQHSLAVAPDGTILYAQIDHSHFDIMVMEYVR